MGFFHQSWAPLVLGPSHGSSQKSGALHNSSSTCHHLHLHRSNRPPSCLRRHRSEYQEAPRLPRSSVDGAAAQPCCCPTASRIRRLRTLLHFDAAFSRLGATGASSPCLQPE